MPGIDFSDDPLLQGRNFSYLDTQLSRLGSPNFHELPINRPVCPFSNNQRDAQMRQTINKGRVAYAPASLDGHSPEEVTNDAGFKSYPETVNGPKVRARSESFGDHYGQARLFWNSMMPFEKEHIVKALSFELSLVETPEVRTRMLGNLAKINDQLAAQIGLAIGEEMLNSKGQPSGTADSAPEIEVLANAESPTTASGGLQKTSGLTQASGQPTMAKARKVAILTGKGSFTKCVEAMMGALEKEGAMGVVVGPHLGEIAGDEGSFMAKKTYGNAGSVLFDAVYIPGCTNIEALVKMGDARKFVDEAFKHGKAIAASGEGTQLVGATEFAENGANAPGVFLAPDGNALDVSNAFIAGVAQHRFRDREALGMIAA